MDSPGKEEMELIKQLVLDNKCICGCGTSVNSKHRPQSLYTPGHHTRLPLSVRQKQQLIELRKTPCLCGCGEMVWYKWKNGGHQAYGVNGYQSRFRNKHKEGKGRGKYPSEEEIINAHASFLEEQGIAEVDKCWACQKVSITEICHIDAYSDGGSNQPLNLVLLCPLCHGVQHGFSFRTYDWSLEKQYDWIRMMRKWNWK